MISIKTISCLPGKGLLYIILYMFENIDDQSIIIMTPTRQTVNRLEIVPV